MVRTIGGERSEGIFKIGQIREVEDAVGEVTLFIKFVGVEESQEVTTIGLFMIEGMLKIKFRNEELDLGTAFGVIEIDTVSIIGGEMSDNMERVNEFIVIRLKGFFDEEFDDKLGEDSLDFFSESDEGISGIGESA